jgi:hypothetical protein
LECPKESVPGTSRIRVTFDDAAQPYSGAAWSRPLINPPGTMDEYADSDPGTGRGGPELTEVVPACASPRPHHSFAENASLTKVPPTTSTAARFKLMSLGVRKQESASASGTSAATTRGSTDSPDGSPQPLPRGPPSASIQRESGRGVVGEVTEPFWVRRDAPGASLVSGDGFMGQHTGTSRDIDECWQEPDDLFLREAIGKVIMLVDIQKFWEMLKCVIDMPALGEFCRCPALRSHDTIASLLQKPEYKVLWIRGDPTILPKHVACEVMREKCVVSPMELNM